MAEDFKIERCDWPGPLTDDIDLSIYLAAAFEPLDAAWCWRSPALREACMEAFNPDQLALLAVLKTHWEINNGGFKQVLYNPVGQLAEQAVDGFRLFDLYEHADLLDGAFAYYVRPIPLRQSERWLMMEEVLGVELGPLTEDGHDLGRVSDLFSAAAELEKDTLDRYFDLADSVGDLEDILARKVAERWESFFVSDRAR